MRYPLSVFALLLFAFVAGCSGLTPAPDVGPVVQNVTYSGSIPCADCRSQQMTVTLFADRTFRLKRTYTGLRTGGGKTVYDLGRWSRKGGRLVLDNGERWPVQFRYVSNDEIRLLDQRGNEIVSKLDYSLRRSPVVDMLSVPMNLRGRFVADSGVYRFTECKTGKTYPLVFERPDATVERQYLALRQAPGKPLMATLKGTIAVRRVQKGGRAAEHVIVRSFGRFWPGVSCSEPLQPAAGLSGTYWRPISIAGFAGSLRGERKGPHVVLSAQDGGVKGFTGCNSLMGSYTASKATISFGKLATTRMACPGASGDVERAFLGALKKAAAWKISGRTLELFDGRHRVLMRLKAE